MKTDIITGIPDIEFKLSGKQFDNGHDLYSMLRALTNFQRILDKSYLTIKGKQRMTDIDRQIFQVKAKDFREGSFITDIGMHVLTAGQLALPVLSELTPKQIWDLVVQGFEYLKVALQANSDGQAINIETSGDSNMVTVITGENNKVLVINPDAIPFIGKAENNFEKLADLINLEEGIEEVSFIDKASSDKGVKINSEDKLLFESKTKLEKDPVVFIGKIFRADFREFSGKLTVIRCDDNKMVINNKEYIFECINKNDIESLTDAIMKKRKIHALMETTFDPSSLRKTITKLKLIGFE